MKSTNISLSRIVRILPPKQQRGLWVLLVISLVAAIFETAGVASILPFMAVVLDPAIIARHPAFTAVLVALGAQSVQDSLVLVGILTVAVLLLGNAASAGTQWAQLRFMANARKQLSGELFEGYMHQPYAFHVQHDAAQLIKVIQTDVDTIIGFALSPLLAAVTRSLVALGILFLVFLRNPFIAFFAALILGGAYVGVFWVVRQRQAKLGSEMSQASGEYNRSILEGLGGIKELLVLGREADTVSRTGVAMAKLADTRMSNILTSLLPKYILESIAFGGIVAVTLTLIIQGGNVATAIPTLALYAFVGYRLMPALQQIFSATVSFKFAAASIHSIEEHLARVRASTGSCGQTSRPPSDISPLLMQREIRIERLCFAYPGTSQPALNNVSLTIKRNQSIGLVGRTGAGKTTLADVLLGLYEPTGGSITIDGVPLNRSNLRQWHKRLGYVPQTVFLANATVAQNIALGLSEQQIDQAAVERAARMAQAHEFIDNLPQGYATFVGERGVKLSGGQRQRLGIARALYHNPDVLVFDEATSALDGMTEDAVMEAIRNLSGERTVILVAHRLRTVEACDRIVMLDGGTVVADGPFHELIKNSKPFSQLAGNATTAAPPPMNPHCVDLATCFPHHPIEKIQHPTVLDKG